MGNFTPVDDNGNQLYNGEIKPGQKINNASKDLMNYMDDNDINYRGQNGVWGNLAGSLSKAGKEKIHDKLFNNFSSDGTVDKSRNSSSNQTNNPQHENSSHNKSPLINDEFAPDGTNPISDYSTEGLNNKLTSDELEGAKKHNDINRENVIAMDNKTAGQKSLLSRLENAKSKATTPRDIERISQLQDTIKDAFSENGPSMTEKAFSEVKGYIGV